MNTNTPSGLPLAGLETAYDSLAEAIDRAGEAKATLFLVKLALLNANALGDAERFREHIALALRDL